MRLAASSSARRRDDDDLRGLGHAEDALEGALEDAATPQTARTPSARREPSRVPIARRDDDDRNGTATVTPARR